MVLSEILPSGYNPVVVFTIVLLIILLAPLLFERLRIPGIVGLIVAGMVFGPHGLGWLDNNAAFRLFGTVGLLYIMFMAGLDLDLHQFQRSRKKSLAFGMLTFLVPLAIGLPVCYYVLGYGFLTSLLVSSMFSTHTLIAYPIVQKLGITKDEAVVLAVGGTLITDSLVLILLSAITSVASGEASVLMWTKLILLFSLFSVVVLRAFPPVARWFFRHVREDGVAHFVFVLTLVFIASWLFELAGFEPMIGAFLAGLALNTSIPRDSPLMGRIEFAGYALFIPFFLIGVGMLIDMRSTLASWSILKTGLTLSIVALVGKWMAARLARQTLGLSPMQGKLLFGLSSSHAAATIAVILVGFRMNIVDEVTLNATVLLILVTCITASLVTAGAGRAIALQSQSRQQPVGQVRSERILVPIANPQTMKSLIDFALAVKDPRSAQPPVPFMVVEDDDEAEKKLQTSKSVLQAVHDHASLAGQSVEIVTRIDVNASSAISRASRELGITDIVIGWHARLNTTEKIFGTTLDLLLKQCNQNLFVGRFSTQLPAARQFQVFVPENAEIERGFASVMVKMLRLADRLKAQVHLFGSHQSRRAAIEIASREGFKRPLTWKIADDPSDPQSFLSLLRPEHLAIVVCGRPGSFSYHADLEALPERIAALLPDTDSLIIYTGI